jgi:hypothetical protein
LGGRPQIDTPEESTEQIGLVVGRIPSILPLGDRMDAAEIKTCICSIGALKA